MQRRLGEVYDRLNAFEESLFTMDLTRGVRLEYWEEIDELDTQSLENIETTVNDAFDDIRLVYRSVPEVLSILDESCLVVQNMVWAGMNVPYPRDPYHHAERLATNVLRAWDDVYMEKMFDKMLEVGNRIEFLQRNWRECISNPSYQACRRRLDFEFYRDQEYLVARLQARVP